ncbi:homocysteine-responsive endoplasmic reticulum-resident ubiquitin-like domain member 1 protein [Chanos chanos]|uniref:Homocysteine-responsive endoplasmic reticulum-resident ubiquitin-like domain member 1 protein n=1 Tax=Chanos chanos TaxID=29144 RepID=A0A6J2WMA4_CHACN|nr:homocysteine-responsive endoplasmic reticulum-resident ubiquitin-like domain member 1 protein [Chanos chanos]
MDDSNTSGQHTISLVVKTPNQVHGDQVIEKVDMNWTVKDLKMYLSKMYPTKPAVKDQRLIYSGKLLQDNQRVDEVFGKAEVTPTVHLVCAFRTPSTAQQAAMPKAAAPEPQSTRSSATPVRQNSDAPASLPSVPAASSSADGLRHRTHPTPASPAAAWPGTGMPASMPGAGAGAAGITHPAFPTYSLYSPQQLLWLQHMYARQYYMQYHAALAAAASAPIPGAPAGPPLPVAPHPAAVPAALPNQAPINNLPANQNAPDPAFINPEGANQNLRMNAQGGPVMEDDEDVERDWLDWVYTAARFGVFLSIVYFYSSISRFLLVMSSLLLMYLHTAGWFPFRRRPQARVPNQPDPEVIQNQQNQNQARQPDQAEPPAGAEGEVEPGQQPPMPAVLVPQVRVSIVYTAWVFFKAFFASLIPEAPQGVAN